MSKADENRLQQMKEAEERDQDWIAENTVSIIDFWRRQGRPPGRRVLEKLGCPYRSAQRVAQILKDGDIELKHDMMNRMGLLYDDDLPILEDSGGR